MGKPRIGSTIFCKRYREDAWDSGSQKRSDIVMALRCISLHIRISVVLTRDQFAQLQCGTHLGNFPSADYWRPAKVGDVRPKIEANPRAAMCESAAGRIDAKSLRVLPGSDS